jgi:hypothetical protein
MNRLTAIPVTATALLAIALATQTAPAQPIYPQQIIYRQPKLVATLPTLRVSDLVRVLSDESFEKRDRAVRSLLEMGTPILPELRWELEHIDAGIPKDERSSLTDHIPQPYHAFHELRVVVDRLEERRKSTGSIITLKFDDAPLIDALRELARQAEWDLNVRAPDQATIDQLTAVRVTFDLERVSFWKAIQEIRQKAGGILDFTRTKQITLTKPRQNIPADDQTEVVSGVLRIVPEAIQSNPTGTRITLHASVEPKLANTGVHAMVHLDECTDDQSRSLLVAGQDTFQSEASENRRDWKVPVELAPIGAGRRIKSMKGRLAHRAIRDSRWRGAAVNQSS